MLEKCCFCGEAPADVDEYKCQVCGAYFTACEACMDNYCIHLAECTECKGI